MTRPVRSAALSSLLVVAVLAACGGTDPAPAAQPAAAETVPTLYWVDVYANAVYRATGPDFIDAEVIVEGTDAAPDGVDVDLDAGKLYWTSMGNPFGSDGQWPGEVPPLGTLQRANLDGSGVERILEPGLTRTPKQVDLDLEGGQLFWGDREGAAVWRAGLDGSEPTAVVTGHGLREVVGVAVDRPAGRLYFSDRTGKKIFRMGLEPPAGQTAADRTDVEEVFTSSGTSMPIDLEIDHETQSLYWTDRLGGTVQRAGLELLAGETAATRTDVETVLDGLDEPIGLSLDRPRDRLYYSELGGGVTEVTMDGEDARRVGRSTGVTGVRLVHLPAGGT